MNRGLGLKIVVAFVAIIIISCEKKEPVVQEIQTIPVDTSQMIRWHLFNDKSLHNMSFPNWINADQVKEKGLDSLIITFYRYREESNIRISRDTFPDEVWRFSFYEQGWIKNLTIDEFNEGIHIASHEFDYQDEPDSLGYSAPSLSTKYLFTQNSNQVMGILNQVEDLKIFNRLLYASSDSTAVTFKNVLSQQRARHIYILDSTNWNVRFIDQHFKAKGRDFFYFGTPKKFQQCFKLDNLVEKELIQVNTYFPNGVITSQELHEGGFYRLRTFEYKNSGRCTMFKDSIFSLANEYVYQEDVVIKYNQNLPESISVYAGKDSTRTNPKRRFVLDYVPKEEE